MSWAQSLIKLAAYEVEVLQKRLGEIVERRLAAEARLASLDAEGALETAFSAEDARAGFYRIGYLEGLKARKAAALAQIAELRGEEQGARDALAEAFEGQKKYEQVAETARRLELKAESRRDAAALDELGLRKAAR